MKYVTTEIVVAAMLTLLILGTTVINIFNLNAASGTGSHIGVDVRDTGTNPWQ